MGGSSVIETSIIIPLIMAIYLIAICGGIGIYKEVRENATCELVANQWEVDDFYRCVKTKELLNREKLDDQ